MSGRPRHILVVDNEPDFLEFMRELLQDEGHRVDTVDSAEAARQHLADVRPDLIISDLLVWGRDPGEVARMLATEPLLTGIPILICSAAVRELDVFAGGDRAEGLDALGKPFSIEDLIERIERLFARGDELGLCGGAMD